jgi:uncharacterized membrane protein
MDADQNKTPSGNVGGQGAAGSGTGLAPNMAGALSYVLGIVTGIVFVLLEKDNNFVRFHAFQSIILSVAWIGIQIAFTILGVIFFSIPVIDILWGIFSILFSIVMGLGAFILWIILIIKAYQGERFSLPFIGPMAEKYAAQK